MMLTPTAAEYKGKKVTLNKPFRTSGGPKKFAVYVQNPGGRVVIVRFGDPNMEIKRDDPKRRKAFRDRHNCAEKKDRTTPGYWSCRQWRKSAPVQGSEDEDHKDYPLWFDEWSANEEQVIFPEFEQVAAEPCCDDCGEHSAAEDNPCETGYKQLGMKEKDGRKVPNCVPIAQAPEEEDEDEDDEDEEYVKSQNYKKDKKKASCDTECGVGEELIAGECVRVAVTTEIEMKSAETIIEASTGKTVVKISGVAFHEGMNKNNWTITRKGADLVVSQMVGADVTLNHPKAEHGRFKRNMAGIDEGVVGRVTSAEVIGTDDSWEVSFEATVERSELFEVLESGLWFRSEYGVSIGGTGVPDKILEAEDGKSNMIFETDFTFDHLAIVHKPAYPRARIETAVKLEEAVSQEMLKYDSAPDLGLAKAGTNMSDETIIEEKEIIEASAEAETSPSEMELALILANSKVAEFEAAEEARIESARLSVVKEASEMGLKGHDDLPEETIRSLMASWEASRPAPSKEMKPVTPASPSEVVASHSNKSEAVVANYLNGELLKTPEAAYVASFNALVAAYNRGAGSDDLAPTFEDAKAKGMI